MNETEKNIPHKISILKGLEQDILENKNIDVLKAYRQTQSKIKRQSRKNFFINGFNKVAAILVLPLLFSTLFFIYLFLNKGESDFQAITIQPTYTEVTAAPGTIIKTTLPDESEVWLNSGTTLRYPSWFTGEKRSVKLAGEAFFEVKTNPDFPFEVEIPSGMKVLAKGTSFNINAYVDDDVHEVVLQQGKVDAIQNDRITPLLPSEMISLNTNTGQVWKTRINLEEKTDWKEGLFIFRSTPLEDVFKRLSRRYNVDFNVQNKSAVNYRIRATFSTETVTQILDVLKLAAPISWSVREVEQQTDLSFTRRQIDIVIH